MYWINLLHIYQPPTQSRAILEKVANESYRPLFRSLLKLPKIKINLNINAGLTKMLAKNGYLDIIKNIKELADSRRLEFTESAEYHPLLPFLAKDEAVRQIKKNHFINKKYFGKNYNPQSFFPPEMAYSKKVGKIISSLGYKTILLDEICYNGGKTDPPTNKIFKIKEAGNLSAVFRERRVSNGIMSAIVRTEKEFIEIIGKDELKKEKYLLTAMDGETFGHHRPGLENNLFKILRSNKVQQIFISEAIDKIPVAEKLISPVEATWAASAKDIKENIQFYSWKNPKNKIHRLQWKFFNYLVKESGNKPLPEKTREKIDMAMASDQFFWASGEPWWSIEMIEKGAWVMLSALKSIPKIGKAKIAVGENYYKDILATAFWWQRNGKIERQNKKYNQSVKIPFKERTLGENKPEVYYAFIDLMKKKMKEAAREKNYERAILWRDAIWKIETKNDIYDAIHAVDMLRLEISDKKIRDLMDKYKEKYRKIKPGQPEFRKI